MPGKKASLKSNAVKKTNNTGHSKAAGVIEIEDVEVFIFLFLFWKL